MTRRKASPNYTSREDRTTTGQAKERESVIRAATSGLLFQYTRAPYSRGALDRAADKLLESGQPALAEQVRQVRSVTD